MVLESKVLVSIVMTAYNVENYIKETIESLLNQTFKAFELIIVDDASTDRTLEIVKSFDDKRITVVVNNENFGAAKSSNIGIKLAKGKYIARADSDDLYYPDRLKMQFEFMENNPLIGVCGALLDVFFENGKVEKWQYTDNDGYFKSHLLFNPQVGHPVIMIRKDVLIENNIWYDEDFKRAIDYELYTRLIEFTNFYNIQTPLMKYRKYSTSLSGNAEALDIYANKVRLNMLSKLNLFPDEGEWQIHLKLSKHQKLDNFAEYNLMFKWVDKILESNLNINYFDHNQLTKVLLDKIRVVTERTIRNVEFMSLE